MENIITFINNLINMIIGFMGDAYMHIVYGECTKSFEGNLFEFATWSNRVNTSMEWADNALFVVAAIMLAIVVMIMIWTVIDGIKSVSEEEA